MTEKDTKKEQETAQCPILVNEARCKSCAKCVRECPLGVLSMRTCPDSIYGIMISVDRSEYCIGCLKCENACPDMAILVKGKNEFPYPKHSKETIQAAKARQAKILENDCRTPAEDS
jgi:2-oxoglutarate ferredoxin oxidoreductase subunit delta